MAKILIVEDDMLIARMEQMRLTLRGHEVTHKENGQLGVEATLAGEYDLVLMDMHMPVLDGHQATVQLREKGYKGIIVAVTASAMSEDSQKAIASGCNFHIPKPIGEDFEDKIESFL